MSENDRLYKAYEKPKIWNVGKEETPDWIKDLMPHHKKIKPEGESMNDLERLKRAEEAESMAVVAFPIPKSCRGCYICEGIDGCDELRGCPILQDLVPETGIHENCPAKKAIGIIEPNGHVVFLREDEGQ